MVITDVFFDLDRTLWDFDTNSDLALRDLFSEFSLDKRIEQKDQFISDYERINEELWDDYRKGLTTKEVMRVKRFHDALMLHGVNDVALAEEYCYKYIENCPKQTATFPDTHEMLEDLKKLGKRLHIITNGFSEVQYKKMTNCGIIDYFDVIVCSDQVGVSKPDPEIFNVALKQSNAKAAHSMMIGDHPEIDVLGANQVGIRGILFDPMNHYKPHPSMEKISGLKEIPNLLLGLKI